MICLMTTWGRHERELRLWFAHRLGDAQEADDLLQDLFIKALSRNRQFCEMVNARAWLFAVARNILIDHLRRRKAQVELPEDLQAPHEEPVPVDTLAACLPRALTELSADDREALTLCDLEGLTQEAYAQLKGLSLPGAKSRVQRARKRLREHLSKVCQVRLDETGRVCCFVARPPTGDPS